jgi:hypothetical protein
MENVEADVMRMNPIEESINCRESPSNPLAEGA